eukprot:GHRQ01024651.1.p2 GENE.GHRQ01024651.1~~GHRQ01024651.1.p2  ORF type:complete len:125 (-),score=24.15 GHRQ01024651.1:687-1061(-)
MLTTHLWLNADPQSYKIACAAHRNPKLKAVCACSATYLQVVRCLQVVRVCLLVTVLKHCRRLQDLTLLLCTVLLQYSSWVQQLRATQPWCISCKLCWLCRKSCQPPGWRVRCICCSQSLYLSLL